MNKSSNVIKRINKLAPYVKPYKWAFILSILFVVLAAVLNALAPSIEGMVTSKLAEDASNIFNNVVGAKVDMEYIISILVILFIIYLSYTVLAYASNFLLTNSIQNSMRDLREAVQSKIRKLPISYFDGNSYGDVLSRITNDIDTISNALQQSFTQVIFSILAIILAIFMMYSINAVMATIAIFIIPISYFVSKFIVNKSQNLFDKQQNALGKLNGKVQEMYTGFNEIKLYGKEEDSLKSFKEANEELCENGFKAQFVSSTMSPLVALISYLGVAIISLIGPMYVVSGVIKVGALQAFVRYVWQINQPLSQMTQLSSVMQSAYAAIGRVIEILEEEEQVSETNKPIQLENVHGDVTFENVEFGYSGDKILIKDLSAEIKAGQMVAIVGPTGAGKTTLINLLMRFYELSGGAIKIDGVDTRDMTREDLRSIFGMVLQDTWLFNGTIYENIEYGRFGATKEEIINAAKIANVHHFIKTLPDGYDMRLNEEASNISQGEKQLLTIARAVISDPKILILDEATSSVDTRIELMLQKAMKNIMKGRTSFVIAHRLSTIRSADLILVVNDGSIIEKGNHEELIAKKGFYEKLYNSQFK